MSQIPDRPIAKPKERQRLTADERARFEASQRQDLLAKASADSQSSLRSPESEAAFRSMAEQRDAARRAELDEQERRWQARQRAKDSVSAPADEACEGCGERVKHTSAACEALLRVKLRSIAPLPEQREALKVIEERRRGDADVASGVSRASDSTHPPRGPASSPRT